MSALELTWLRERLGKVNSDMAQASIAFNQALEDEYWAKRRQAEAASAHSTLAAASVALQLRIEFLDPDHA